MQVYFCLPIIGKIKVHVHHVHHYSSTLSSAANAETDMPMQFYEVRQTKKNRSNPTVNEGGSLCS